MVVCGKNKVLKRRCAGCGVYGKVREDDCGVLWCLLCWVKWERKCQGCGCGIYSYLDFTADCFVYKCGNVNYSLDANCGEWVENNKGNCGWLLTEPINKDKYVVARTTVKSNGYVKLRVSVSPSVSKKLSLKHRQLIGNYNESKTNIAKTQEVYSGIRKHLNTQIEYIKCR